MFHMLTYIMMMMMMLHLSPTKYKAKHKIHKTSLLYAMKIIISIIKS